MSKPMPTIPTQSPFTYPNPNSSASPSFTQDDTFMPNPSASPSFTQDDTFMPNMPEPIQPMPTFTQTAFSQPAVHTQHTHPCYNQLDCKGKQPKEIGKKMQRKYKLFIILFLLDEHSAYKGRIKVRTLLLQPLPEDHYAPTIHHMMMKGISGGWQLRQGQTQTMRHQPEVSRDPSFFMWMMEENGLKSGNGYALLEDYQVLRRRQGRKMNITTISSLPDLRAEGRYCAFNGHKNMTGEVEKGIWDDGGLHADNGGAGCISNCLLMSWRMMGILLKHISMLLNTLVITKDWFHKTPMAFREKIRAQKEKKEWEVKFEATLARFEKWKESSKNLKKLINSSMSTRTKIGLGFQEYFGVDEVFDLSTPSVFYSDPVEKEVKPLYSRFVRLGKMHGWSPPITGTYMPSPYQSDIEETQVSYGSKSDNKTSDTISESNDFVSCDNSDKSSDSETHTSCDSSLKTKTKDFPPCLSWEALSIWRGDGRISGEKATIRSQRLDFDIPNVYYVEELQHFNLRIQLPDASQVQNESLDESTRRTQKDGLCDFKTINKLAKGGLVGWVTSKAYQQKYYVKLEAEFENQGVSVLGILLALILLGDPAGIDSAVREPAGIDSAVRDNACHYILLFHQFSVTSSPMVMPDESTLPPGQSLGSVQNTKRFHPSDVTAVRSESVSKRVNTIHPQSQILGDLASPDNHTDHLHCLSACFFLLEPTSIAKALRIPDWVVDMQEVMPYWMLRVPFSMEKLKKKCMSLSLKALKIPTSQSMLYRVVKSFVMGLHQAPRDCAMGEYELLLRSNSEQLPDSTIHSAKTTSDVDIMLQLGACSRHSSYHPLNFHMNAVKEILYCDYAVFHGDRKSLQGGCQFLWQQLRDHSIVKNPVFHQRTKHIEIRHHFIRDANEKNLIQVLKIHTDDNVADLLTKAFDGPRFGIWCPFWMVVNTAGRCTFFLLTGLVSAACTMVLLVVILSAGRLVSAGRTMILLVVILSAGRLVSAGSYGLCCWFRVHAGGHISAGGSISADRVFKPAGLATPMAGFAVPDTASGTLGTNVTASTVPTSAVMDSAGSHRESGVSPFADSADSSSPPNVSTAHIPIDVLFDSTSRGITEFFLISDAEEQIGLSRVTVDPDSDDEVLAEILFRGQYISGAGVVVMDKLPYDEIVDPRVKVETVSDYASSPPRSRRKHLGV
ncbi:hypothetical protein Tco_1043423, partial [Tanacetum coccineum]